MVTDLLLILPDPVLISNITSNSSRLGQDIAVSVQFSGEEAAVTWEVDGGSLPHRYRLMDDNRTLIIPSAQREDAGRRLRVRITNPVSEETREYLLEITGPRTLTLRLSLVAAALAVVILLSAGIFLCCRRKNMAASKDGEMKQIDGPSEENGLLQDPINQNLLMLPENVSTPRVPICRMIPGSLEYEWLPLVDTSFIRDVYIQG
ncbi:uncharacterized protein [Eleutherodactylus coqui]|uniref:uncharacterized protein n=1 Tax=Eleutherodactylus coqui TaxID=57060 RepID=UPI003461B2E4